MSKNFGTIDFDHLSFPSTLRVDYIRVYQDPNAINVGCDPSAFPTAAYINEYVQSHIPFSIHLLAVKRWRVSYTDADARLHIQVH